MHAQPQKVLRLLPLARIVPLPRQISRPAAAAKRWRTVAKIAKLHTGSRDTRQRAGNRKYHTKIKSAMVTSGAEAKAKAMTIATYTVVSSCSGIRKPPAVDDVARENREKALRNALLAQTRDQSTLARGQSSYGLMSQDHPYNPTTAPSCR